MMSEDKGTTTPLIDEWLDEIGEEAVLQIVEEARRRANDGSLTALERPTGLDAHARQHRRPSA